MSHKEAKKIRKLFRQEVHKMVKVRPWYIPKFIWWYFVKKFIWPEK